MEYREKDVYENQPRLITKEQMQEFNSLVVKSNQLVESIRDNCNATELKVINILISKMKPGSEYSLGKNIPLSFKDFKALCHSKTKNTSWFKKNCLSFFNKTFCVQDKEKKTETLYHYFHKIKIDYGSEIVYFDFEEEIMPFITELKRNFTRYPLQFTLLMKSKYSIRLYELLKDLQKGDLYKKVVAVDTQGLRETLGVPESVRFNDFKRYMLDPACCEVNSYDALGFYRDINNSAYLKEVDDVSIGEINVYSDLIVSYRPVKYYSKSYNIIEFHIEPKTKDMILAQRKVNEEYLTEQIGKPLSYYKKVNKCVAQTAMNFEEFERNENE